MIKDDEFESDVTIIGSFPPSTSRKAKGPLFYIYSPPQDSNDSDSSSGCGSGASSSSSSVSRFPGLTTNLYRKRNYEVIHEEDDRLSRFFPALIALLAFVLLFTIFSLIIWGASRPFNAEIVVKRFAVNHFYLGEGSDYTGVPTKMLTANCSLEMSIYNPATFFGIHVSSTPVNLLYSDITIATGQLKKYYQPRKSQKTVMVTLEGNKVPLYGAGTNLAVLDNRGRVPLRLEFGIRSRGYLVGKLVKTKHQRQISCPVVIDSRHKKPIYFMEDSCTFD